MRWLVLAGLMACNETGLSSNRDPVIAVTYGDFDDLTPSLDRLLVNHEIFEGLISNATWSDDPVAGIPVESLFSGRRMAYEAILVTSGTRGFGSTVYNRNEPDDTLVSDDAVLGAVEDYARGGGRLLATDWSYDLIERTWPDAIDFFGDDAQLDAAQHGDVAQVIARVTDPRLQQSLGMDQVVLDYNFSNWAVIEDVGPDTTVWLRGDVTAWDGELTARLTDVPLLVSFETNRGLVVVQTFHTNAQTFAVADTLLTTVLGELPKAE
jgi:hypothetical protein